MQIKTNKMSEEKEENRVSKGTGISRKKSIKLFNKILKKFVKII